MCGKPALFALLLVSCVALLTPAWSFARDDRDQVLTIDHYVPQISAIPAIAGQQVELYVRERVQAGPALQTPTFDGRVVLFVHGATTPIEAAFDLPYQDYSWMAYLAQAGFDVFAMDHLGYGRSTRPAVMDDPCNVTPELQQLLMPAVLAESCPPSYTQQLTTIATDWTEIDRVVDYVRALRHVDKISLVAWSRGGPRAGGYATRFPDKVDKLVLLAPAYWVSEPFEPMVTFSSGVPMTIGTRDTIMAGWDRQVGCADEFDPAIRDVVWSQMLDADPTGSTWLPGVQRAPVSAAGGWTPDLAAKVQSPTLLVSGEFDSNSPQTFPERVRKLYDDLGTRHKVFVDLACSSHQAIWEYRHMSLFQASRDWLESGSVNGMREGALRLGD